MVAAQPLAQPKRCFGDYTLLDLVGRGGMAEVYRARLQGPQGFSKQVAVKILRPELVGEATTVQSFIDEAQIAAALNHPNIVNVYNFGEQDGQFFMAMEYVEGWDLQQVLERSRASAKQLPLHLAVYIVREACRALEYIHGLTPPVIHRDVTPHNLLLTQQGAVKLGDFGIAKSGRRRSKTQYGQIKGKLAYLAPEQVSEGLTSQQTDIYAAGLILFEIVAGRRLIEGKQPLELLRAARNPEHVSLRQCRPAAGKLDPIIERALQHDPRRRFATAAQMTSALDAFLETEGQRVDASVLAKFLDASMQQTAPTACLQPTLSSIRSRENNGSSPARPDHRHTRRLTENFSLTLPMWRVARLLLVMVISGALGLSLALWLWPLPDKTGNPSSSRRAGTVEHMALPAQPDRGAAIVSLRATSRPTSDRTAGDDAKVAQAVPESPAPSVGRRGRSAVAAKHSRRGAGKRRRRSSKARSFPRRRPANSDRSPVDRPARSKATESKATRSEPSSSALAIARTALRRRVAEARRRGLWPGDDAGFDRLRLVTKQALRRTDIADAKRQLTALGGYIDGFRLSRRFVERKMRRLERAMKATASRGADKQRLNQAAQRIVRLVLDGKLTQASRLISETQATLDRH